jgi:GT2 family glycosyltransferase
VKLSVVVSTYERPAELEAVLRALADQSEGGFEVVVADDGSGPETAAVVERLRGSFGGRLALVWQEDEGYRLALGRNRAALSATGDYLVFVDGDCVPRRGFARALRRAARPGWFVAGIRLPLDEELTRAVLERRRPVHRWSVARWLVHGRGRLPRPLSSGWRDRRRVGRPGLPEFEPHAKAYGFLLGVSRADFERANGFDARYAGWGEEDVDLALRLRRLGLRCGHAGPGAVLLHLWHAASKPPGERNVALLRETEESDRVQAVLGLRELRAEAAQASAWRTAGSATPSPESE